MQCQPLLLQLGDLRGEFAVAAHGGGELVLLFGRIGVLGGEPRLQFAVFCLRCFELFFQFCQFLFERFLRGVQRGSALGGLLARFFFVLG